MKIRTVCQYFVLIYVFPLQRGYGLQTLKILQDFYEGNFISDLSENITTTPRVIENDSEISSSLFEVRADLPSLLSPLDRVKPELLDYIGVSYGLSEDLLR